MVQKFDLDIDYGASYRRSLEFPVPWDLTGCTVSLTILSSRSNPTVYDLTLDHTTNKVDLYFSPTQTRQLRRFHRHTYYIDVKYLSGDVIRIIEGKIK
jgi:hypothetical protein